MILVIDNYDSFTYNLVQYFGELGAAVVVYRNDRISIEELVELGPSHIVISPGSGLPEDSGISPEVIRHFYKTVPILGVCLGHQAIAHAFGGTIGQAPTLMHGKTSKIYHAGQGMFANYPSPFTATRYHSLIVEEPLPAELEVTAFTSAGEIMALQHRERPVFGVQFHPESILTQQGKRLLANFLAVSGFAETGGGNGCLREALALVIEGDSLSEVHAESVMSHIMTGEATPVQIGGLLCALRAKKETPEEITGFARAMRRNAITVSSRRAPLVDVCGTGGDGSGTFNISTATAFVIAGSGLAVAKHGNRSVSSKCGSADVLETLGVNLTLSAQDVASCIDEIGIGFLFAPSLHPAMKHAIGPRREMGIRTVFNILGPLTNPATTQVQLLGVYDPALTEVMAQVLRALDCRAAFVVHGGGGLDELSTIGPNRVTQLHEGEIHTFTLDPESFGIPSASLVDLRGGSAEVNATIIRRILEGKPGPARDVVMLNAAAALVAAEVAPDFPAGLTMAAASIDSGAAESKLNALIAFTNEQGKPA